MLCLWSACQILVFSIKNGKYSRLVDTLYRLLACYCLLSVISVLSIGVTNSATTTYLFGGKFITSYFFLMFLGFSYAKHQERIDARLRYRLIFGFMCLFVFLFEVYLRCTTGYVIILFFYCLLFLPKITRQFLTRKVVVTAAVIITGLIPIFINGILSISVVQNVIVNILGKSINLTSRLPIYTDYLFPLVKERLIFGNGYASSVMHLRTGVYWNAQNGLFDIILNYGVIGTAGFLTAVFRATGNKNSDSIAWPFYAVLYSLILASTIEVSYDLFFFFTLSMIFASKYYVPEAAK